MIVNDLVVANKVGWFVGLILPLGSTSLRSRLFKRNFNILYFTMFQIVYTFFSVELILLMKANVGTFDTGVKMLMDVLVLLSVDFLRFSLLVLTKRINQLLVDIETFNNQDPPRKSGSSVFEQFLTWSVLVLSVSVSIAYYTSQTDEESLVRRSTTGFPYVGFVLLLFAWYIPHFAINYIIFVYVLAITNFLLRTFNNFCDAFERRIQMAPIEFEKVPVKPEPTGLFEFYQMLDIFRLFDSAVGPLIVGIVIVNVIGLIQGMTGFLLDAGDTAEVVFAGLYCAFQLIPLYVLHLGHTICKQIKSRKLRIHRMVASIENVRKRNKAFEVVRILTEWDWRLSAWGFFFVDRTMTSKILSFSMTYIIILVQLHQMKAA